MVPQERDLITTLLARLKGAAGQPKDPEADALRYANTRSFDSATLCSASARPAQDDKSVSIDHPRNPGLDGSTAASDESWLPQDSAFERLNHYEAGQQVGEQEWKMRSV